MNAVEIFPATTAVHVEEARKLFQEYGNSLNISLSFQGFDAEVAGLPGKYAPPAGQLLLADCNSETAGCVALRPLEEGVCEMKRLFVRPAFRGRDIGRQLAERIIAEARALPYRVMRLDTLESLKPALALYRSLEFREIPAYYHNPTPGVVYLELKLR